MSFTYYYDPFGRRLWKEVSGTRTHFLYSNEGLVGEYDATGNEIKTYGWQPGSTWGTDPLFMKQNGEYFYYRNDHLGTPQQMTDRDGLIVWQARYEAFGKAVVWGQNVNSVPTITNNIRFPGQYWDDETGFHYNWNRFYEPEIGRYLRVDPIGIDGGVNFYAYVNNNSIILMDPYGLKWKFIGWSTEAKDDWIVFGFSLRKFRALYAVCSKKDECEKMQVKKVYVFSQQCSILFSYNCEQIGTSMPSSDVEGLVNSTCDTMESINDAHSRGSQSKFESMKKDGQKYCDKPSD